MSGGAWERVAAFNGTDTNNNEEKYGSSFAGKNKTSTQWATKYSSNDDIPTKEKSKVGDAIWEVYVNVNEQDNPRGWFNDGATIVNPACPFMGRGSSSNDYKKSGGGVFAVAETVRGTLRV